MNDPLKPSVGLLVKLGSIAVHVDEMRGYNFDQRLHEWAFDKGALDGVLNDPEVVEWLQAVSNMAMLPVKR